LERTKNLSNICEDWHALQAIAEAQKSLTDAEEDYEPSPLQALPDACLFKDCSFANHS